MEAKALPSEMQEALAEFDTKSSDWNNSFIASSAGQSAPDVLYHYTNDTGLRGILETGRFWLTDIFCLNDPSELQHGLSVAENVLIKEAEDGSPWQDVFVENFTKFLRSAGQSTAHYFVGSFSVDGNDLGQWRAYADNGRGFALGFDGQLIEEAFIETGNSSTFYVCYDTEVLEYHLTRLILFALKALSVLSQKAFDGAEINEYQKQLSILLSMHVLRTALLFKHKAYNAEAEFRFLEEFRYGQPIEDLQYRHRRHELVKYREFAWRKKEPRILKRIIIGPAAEPIKARRFVEECLAAFHVGQLGEVEIVQSDIPYRAVG